MGYKSPGTVGPRSLWVWRALTYLGGKGLLWISINPEIAFVTIVGLTAGRTWIRRTTWKLLLLSARTSITASWAMTRGAGTIFYAEVPGVAGTIGRATTTGSALSRFVRSPAGKGLGAGLFLGTLITYPILVKEGYIVPSVAISQEQMMKELVSKPGLPPGLGTRPILFGGGGGGIIV